MWSAARPPARTVGLRIVPVDATIIMNPKVWEASGHVGGFSDLMSTCRHCKKLVRFDHIDEMIYESDWYASLKELHGAGNVTIKGVKRWGEKTAKKLAPNLALVRKPAESAGLPDRGAGTDEAPLDLGLEQLVQHLANGRY